MEKGKADCQSNRVKSYCWQECRYLNGLDSVEFGKGKKEGEFYDFVRYKVHEVSCNIAEIN
jgi:hypothetical protein